jgi:hypothetical protein
VEAVEVGGEAAQPLVGGIPQQAPVELAVVVPFPPLPELAPHEQELLPGLGVHVAQEQAQVGPLLPSVPRHAGEERALQVHDLVVGEREHEVLGEGVEHAEGEAVVVELAEDGVLDEVVEGVVHPSHVPLEAEAQAPQPDRPRDHGPGGGLLGDGLDAGERAVGGLVHLPQEVDGLQVLPAAVHVGDPLPGLAGVVEVEHGGHPVHAQPVGVVAVEPEEGAAHEERAHLVPAVIEDEAVPVGVEALAAVGVLVEMGAVEVPQAVLVGGEVAGHPVQDHPDAAPVQDVDQVHEVLGGAVARAGAK